MRRSVNEPCETNPCKNPVLSVNWASLSPLKAKNWENGSRPNEKIIAMAMSGTE
jgi:hypothetical protein